MSKISDALRKLAEKCIAEGHEVTGKTTGDILECIAEHYEGGGGGGSDLPEVTEEDNGKVLTVISGEWDKAEPSGESGTVYLDVVPSQDMTTFTVTKDGESIDCESIIDLVEEGKNVIAKVITSETDYSLFPFADVNEVDGTKYVSFTRVTILGTEAGLLIAKLSSSAGNSGTIEFKPFGGE